MICILFRLWSQKGAQIDEGASNEAQQTCLFEHLTTFSTLFQFIKVRGTLFGVIKSFLW